MTLKIGDQVKWNHGFVSAARSTASLGHFITLHGENPIITEITTDLPPYVKEVLAVHGGERARQYVKINGDKDWYSDLWFET